MTLHQLEPFSHLINRFQKYCQPMDGMTPPSIVHTATDMVQSNRFPSPPAYPIRQVLQDGKCHDRIRFSKVVLSSISGFPVVVFCWAWWGGVGWWGVWWRKGCQAWDTSDWSQRFPWWETGQTWTLTNRTEKDGWAVRSHHKTVSNRQLPICWFVSEYI